MSNAKTEKALTQLLALSLTLRTMPDEVLIENIIGAAHALEFEALALAAVRHLHAVGEQQTRVDQAEDLTAATIYRAMKK